MALEGPSHYKASVSPDVPFYHTFDEADAADLVPNQPTRVQFEMMPTSYCFQKGTCIRLAFSDSDAAHYLHKVKENTKVKLITGPGFDSCIHFPQKAYS